MADFKIGRVDHYYDKINVAIVEVLGTIALGDQIRFGGSCDFSQSVTSLQTEHRQIQEASKGQIVGLKVDQPVKKGDEIYKI